MVATLLTTLLIAVTLSACGLVPDLGSGGGGKGSGSGGAGGQTGLAGRVFFSYDGVSVVGVVFVDGTRAYPSLPEEGFPSCAGAKPACIAYTYSGSGGTVRAGDVVGRLAQGRISPPASGGDGDGLTYEELTLARRGSRVELSGSYVSSVGTAAFASDLQLRSDGSWTRSSGASGDGGDVNVSSDSRGTYTIGDHGEVTLRADDGSSTTRVLAVDAEGDFFLGSSFYATA